MTVHTTPSEVDIQFQPTIRQPDLSRGRSRSPPGRRPASRRRKKLNFRKPLLAGARSPCWPAPPGTAGITGPSAASWSPPMTPM